MLQFLPGFIVGIIAIILHAVNLIIFPMVVIVAGALRFLLPFDWWHNAWDSVIRLAEMGWIKLTNLIIGLTMKTDWEVHGEGELSRSGRYFLIANHQSWVDILILYKLFGSKVPILVFFIKKQLVWSLPFLGFAMWATGFPLMQRHSKSYLKNNPKSRQADIEATKKLCLRFKKHPVTVINFLEATRFTKEKHHRQLSPYKHLLKPHSSKFAFVLSAMGNSLHNIIDVTIIYPEGKIGLWDFVCGKLPKIVVYYKVMPITDELRNGSYTEDRVYRSRIQRWVNDLWLTKDNLICSKSKTMEKTP